MKPSAVEACAAQHELNVFAGSGQPGLRQLQLCYRMEWCVQEGFARDAVQMLAIGGSLTVAAAAQSSGARCRWTQSRWCYSSLWADPAQH